MTHKFCFYERSCPKGEYLCLLALKTTSWFTIKDSASVGFFYIDTTDFEAFLTVLFGIFRTIKYILGNGINFHCCTNVGDFFFSKREVKLDEFEHL